MKESDSVMLCKHLLAISTLLSLAVSSAAAEGPAYNVVLITIDTLRPDHLACYGYASIETPYIDRLAESGARFTQAFTPVPITLPAHTALLTGMFPLATGVHDFMGNQVSPGTGTLARILHDHGYSTAAFLGAPVLDSRFGLNQGFDTYFDRFELAGKEEVRLDAIKRPGDQVVDEAQKWLNHHPPQPVFLWVHLYDAHSPYRPPLPYSERYRGRPYDGEIAFADAQVGRLMTTLTRQGLLEKSLVVLASDHGESLGEHGEKTHGFFIYNSTLHVAFIAKVPGDAPRVVNDEVSLVDVMPTVLQGLGIPIPAGVQGRSLLSLVAGRAGESASNLYAESYPPLLHFGWNSLRSLQSRGWKYIETTRPELYDTRTDPKESKNLYSTHQTLALDMKNRLRTLVSRYTPAIGAAIPGSAPADPALLKSLRSLGYVAASTGSITDASGRTLPDPKDRIQVYELVSAALADDEQKHYAESLRKLQEAEKTGPHSRTIHFLMAGEYFHLNDFPHAAAYYQSALDLDPRNSVAAYYLGVSRLEMGDLEAAERAFQLALELDPASFAAAFNLGVVYSRRQQAEPAIQAFERAIKILPNYADAHEALGELYLYLDRPQEAARELEKAVAIAPHMTKAHSQLARAYTALGLQDKAQQEMERAKTP
ncbi:MAG TPA: sulfatase-like hydrolase/transferase [Terriglobia bacterium]|nr:sulfatase-like hydrolase/transferase [Terriglobia bacterium]